MGHDDVYIYNNRFVKQKEVDEYLDRIGTPHEDISWKKVIIILGVLCVCSGLLGTCALAKKDAKKTESYKALNANTKTAVYKSLLNYTR